MARLLRQRGIHQGACGSLTDATPSPYRDRVTDLPDSIAHHRFAVIDTETTGLDPESCRLLQVAVVVTTGDGAIERQWSAYVRRRHWRLGRLGAWHIHGITRRQLRTGCPLADVLATVERLTRDTTVLAHNAPFDLAFLRAEAQRTGNTAIAGPAVCSLRLSRSLDPDRAMSHALGAIAERAGVTPARAHDALADAMVTAAVLPHLLRTAGVTSPDDLAVWRVD